MAIPVLNGTVTTYASPGAEGDFSYNHTIAASLTNSIVIVFVTSSGIIINGVTYDGVAMTEFVSHVPVSAYPIKGFYLVNPPSGIKAVAVDVGGSAFHRSVAYTLTGVHQTTPIGAINDGETETTSIELSVTTTGSDNLVINCLRGNPDDSNFSHGENQVEIVAWGTTRPNTATYKNAAVAGSISMSETHAGMSSGSMVVAEVNPVLPPSVIKSVAGVLQVSIKKISGDAIATVKKVAGVSNV